ncbi:hypothetical protein LPJ72_005593 [Coemansia sp. Benny D160-2]|nr:hypothetical protein LPJ72_005593 [Coemansia sp. Benny D160-2]
MSSDQRYAHGVLGKWAVVGHGFNIASIVCSALVIIAVIARAIHCRSILKRTTFRLSAWMAVCDIIYSVCQICTFNNTFMTGLPEINLRVIHWLMSASVLTVAFLSGCIGIDLMLAVVSHSTRIANRIRPWYEVASFFLGFVITHPFLYLYKSVQWAEVAQIFHIYAKPAYYKMTSWLTMWGWLFSICTFLFLIMCATVLKMHRELMGKTSYIARSKDAEGFTPYEHTPMSKERQRYIRSVCIRILAYPLIPIITQIWVLAANMTSEAPMWLYVMANIVPAIQGVLNFLAFTANPAWDQYRNKLIKKYQVMRQGRSASASAATSNENDSGFSRLVEEGTMCNSPCASSLQFNVEKC